MKRRRMYRIENPSTGRIDDVVGASNAMSKAKRRATKECGSVGVFLISKDSADIVRYENTSPIWTSDWRSCSRRRKR